MRTDFEADVLIIQTKTRDFNDGSVSDSRICQSAHNKYERCRSVRSSEHSPTLAQCLHHIRRSRKSSNNMRVRVMVEHSHARRAMQFCLHTKLTCFGIGTGHKPRSMSLRNNTISLRFARLKTLVFGAFALCVAAKRRILVQYWWCCYVCFQASVRDKFRIHEVKAIKYRRRQLQHFQSSFPRENNSSTTEGMLCSRQKSVSHSVS
mmetsp:Transcript_2733/g.4395  ORF Transcript_2733/g.4395 Transcript_2733/m.4395 type:complete len:206 (-) Transcript_2733:977-1594(-)